MVPNDVTDVRARPDEPVGAVAAADRLDRPYYRRQLFAARDRARDELRDLDEEQLERVAAEGRKVAGSLDEEGARLTVTLTEDREDAARGRPAREAECCFGAGGRGFAARRQERSGRAS